MKPYNLRDAMRLYAVTDRAWLKGRSLAAEVENAIQGGVTFVQLREKDLPLERFQAEAKEIAPLCRRHGIPFVVNDQLEVALACGADGVHVGQEDMAAGDVRAALGPDKILGVSARTVEQALAAQAAGADYLGVGAVFSTSTKPDAGSVSPETLRAICAAVSIPVVAIGGITAETLPHLTGLGIDGAAVVSALFAAPDIRQAARTLRRLSEQVSRKPLAFQGAIFDMDGTLLDSMSLWDDSTERFLTPRGITPDPDLRELLKPLSIVDTSRFFKERYSLADSEQSIINELNAMVEHGYLDTAPVKRDIIPFLAKLREAGIPMCVATATDKHLAEAALRRTGLRDFFQFVLTCTEAGMGKDNPQFFRLAMERLGTPQADTVVFEDALHAVENAKAAGFRVIAIEEASCAEDQEKIRESADHYIHYYAEVGI